MTLCNFQSHPAFQKHLPLGCYIYSHGHSQFWLPKHWLALKQISENHWFTGSVLSRIWTISTKHSTFGFVSLLIGRASKDSAALKPVIWSASTKLMDALLWSKEYPIYTPSSSSSFLFVSIPNTGRFVCIWTQFLTVAITHPESQFKLWISTSIMEYKLCTWMFAYNMSSDLPWVDIFAKPLFEEDTFWTYYSHIVGGHLTIWGKLVQLFVITFWSETCICRVL